MEFNVTKNKCKLGKKKKNKKSHDHTFYFFTEGKKALTRKGKVPQA